MSLEIQIGKQNATSPNDTDDTKEPSSEDGEDSLEDVVAWALFLGCWIKAYLALGGTFTAQWSLLGLFFAAIIACIAWALLLPFVVCIFVPPLSWVLRAVRRAKSVR